MTIDHFEDLKMARNESFEEAPSDKKSRILNAKITANPQDIDSWLQFVKLQDELVEDLIFATRDSGSKARAAAEKKLEILKNAVQKNAACVELRLEKVKIMEFLYGPTDQRVETEWKNVSVKFELYFKLSFVLA